MAGIIPVMPVSANIPHSFPEPKLVELANRQWYPVYTQPLREYRLADWLLDNDVPFYLPQLKKFTTKHVKRPTKTDVYRYEKLCPMFKGYLFAALDDQGLTDVWHSNHVIRVLREAEQSQKRLLQELNVIRRFELASALGKHRSTVLREIKGHRQSLGAGD
jgi:hypothetical protein